MSDMTMSCHGIASQDIHTALLCSQRPFRRLFSSSERSRDREMSHYLSGKRSSVRKAQASSEIVKATEETSTSSTVADACTSSQPLSDVWELDFSSRPVLDERGKKKWELLICSPDRGWKFAKYFANNKINSTQLRLALEDILSKDGVQKPRRVKFFRSQMNTIISRALGDLAITPVPSRRCFALMEWLEERLETVYKKSSSFSDKASSLFVLDLGPPEKLPDALRGERWSFVQLPLSVLQEELKLVSEGQIFGDTISLEHAGAADLPPDTMIPGVAVYSVRARPLSAWTKSYDLANLTADPDRACLVLETGVNKRWKYASFRRTPENLEEAETWRDARKACKGLHFLAVQRDEETEQCSGLWLMMDRELPAI